MEDGTARARLEPDAENRFVRLRAQLGVTSFGLNQIVLHPGQRGRIHAHERQEEVYLVLEGTLSLFLEGEEATLERGELVRVAPGVKRQLVNRGPGLPPGDKALARLLRDLFHRLAALTDGAEAGVAALALDAQDDRRTLAG